MNITQILAKELSVKETQIESVVQLLDEGNTVPFIARYRKEVTGNIGDDALRILEDRLQYLRNLITRKEEVIARITELGKMTDELQEAIDKAQTLSVLEDIYRPFKQKKMTRATKAKELGLDPIADIIWAQEDTLINSKFEELKTSNVLPEELSLEEAIQGGLDICAEKISDDTNVRSRLKKICGSRGKLSAKKLTENVTPYDTYDGFEEPVLSIPNHRILAMNRGESEKELRVWLLLDEALLIDDVKAMFEVKSTSLLNEAVKDSVKRLVFPSIERELRRLLTERAEEEAIKLFGKNTKALLMTPPIKPTVVIGVDPGFRTGCKVAVLDATGKLLEHTAIYPHEPQSKWDAAKRTLITLALKHKAELIAIGNGTASRETEKLAEEVVSELKSLSYTIVSEAGASVYSASKLAASEYPDLDVTVRGAISIGRRVQDPLAELVKIDPKSIGVGQYQHDVNQKRLEEQLANVVEDVVNAVGVDLNTATPSLLRYVSGISESIAKNIVEYRDEMGVFKNRKELLNVKRLGAKVYEQAVGFLRIRDGEEPLDNTGIHPESYKGAKQFIKTSGINLNTSSEDNLRLKVDEAVSNFGGIHKLAEHIGLGELTLSDILEELKKPGRDPREDMPKPIFKKDVLSLDDLYEGLVLDGTVRNVVDFGAFVDIGVKQDGLVHISQLSSKFIKHPMDVVAVGDQVKVKVIGVDKVRGKVSLTMKDIHKPS